MAHPHKTRYVPFSFICDPLPTEPPLPDSHPIKYGYLYLANGIAFEALAEGTVREFKELLQAPEIRKMDLFQRKENFKLRKVQKPT